MAAASTSDIFDFVVNQGNGIKGLSQMGIKTVPDIYIQPLEARLHENQIVNEESIPVIDLSSWDDPKVTTSICDAAARWGFFQIINHGVPLEILENVRDAAHKFFELPNEERRKFLKENSPTPNVQLNTSFSALAEKVLEWKDWIKLRFDPDDQESCKFWPAVAKDPVLEYIKLMRPIIRKIIEVLLQGLNVKEMNTAHESLLMATMSINLTYYPMCPNPELTTGASPHSDISTMTVLLQDDVGGLYMRGTQADTWIHVTPIKGALVINIGDTLQICSNDKYKSIEHRVIVHKNRNRVSIPVFVNPAPNSVIAPFPELLESSGEKPVYKQLHYSDYFNYFFGKAHDGKKTIEFAKI